MHKYITTTLILISLSLNLYSANEKITTALMGSQIVTSTTPSITLADAYFGANLGTMAKLHHSIATVGLSFDQQVNNFVSSDHDYEVKLYATFYYNFNQTTLQDTSIITLNIQYRSNTPSYTSDEIYTKPGYNKVELTIFSVKVDGNNGTLPANISLWAEIDLERYYKIDNAYIFPKVKLPVHNYLSTSDELEISWPYIDGAESYDLEWAYVNDYSETVNVWKSVDALNYDFAHNSSRINTADNSYKISMIYDHGYIVYRIRGVGYDIDNPQYFSYTPWSLSTTGALGYASGLTVTPIDNIFAVDNNRMHEKELNWQYSATYAEDGKKKEVISYFDGSLRNRQTVSRINSQNQAVVGETVYDYEGRPAVQILPVPVDDSRIKYYPDLNLATSGTTTTAYSYEHFDMDGSTCTSSLIPLDQNSGAALYYSTNNTSVLGAQAFVPNANGYPFSQTEYTPDNTGRIRRQGGVGSTHQLGADANNDKSTRYYYGQPQQEQLDRLFGSEVGNNNHYKKNMVVDPNGQVSISYLNASGKVIATSLAGVAPTNMQELNGDNQEVTSQLISPDLYGNNPNYLENNALNFSSELMVSQQGVYTFNYSVDIASYDELCEGCNFCLDCVYDLTISIKNQCGQEMIIDGPFLTIIGKYDNTSCDVTTTQTIDELVVNLPIGTYTIQKTLAVNEQALDYYTEQYLESSACLKTEAQFFTEASDAADNQSKCDMNCANCLESLGATYKAHLTLYGDESLTQAEYNEALLDCNLPCEPSSSCDILYETLLADVSPKGQYAQYEVDASGVYSATLYPLSIFCPASFLPKAFSASISSGQMTSVSHIIPWQNPIFNGAASDYKDYNGNDYYIPLTALPDGSYYPEPKTGTVTTVYLAADGSYKYSASGTIYAVKPKNLNNLEDFISFWNPVWADRLVEYHPEYGYYAKCSSMNGYSLGSISSEDFDNTLYDYATFSNALAYTDLEDDQDQFDLFDSDPYFQNYQSGSWQYDIMHARLDDFDGDNHTIKQVAAMAVICGGVHSSPDPNCFIFGNTNSPSTDELNQMWVLYRNMYLAEKNKIQTREMQIYASGNSSLNNVVGNGYNGCIELRDQNNKKLRTFDPTAYSFSDDYICYNATAINDQPCNIFTAPYYIYKKRRYIDLTQMSPLNAHLDGDAQSLIDEILGMNEVSNYSQTGECKIAIEVQSLLSEMALKGILTNTSASSLDAYSSFTQQLYDECRINQGSGDESTRFDWEATTVSSSFLEGIIVGDNSEVGAEITLSPVSGSITWSNITTFYNFNHLSHSGDLYSFRVVALLSNNTEQLIYGTVDLPLENCLDPNTGDPLFQTCQTTPLGHDLQILLSAIAANGHLDESAVNLSSSSLYNSLLTNRIKAELGTGTISWDNGTLLCSGSSATIGFNINYNSSYDIDDIISFSNIKKQNGSYNSYDFSITAHYDSSIPIDQEVLDGSVNTNIEIIRCTSTVQEPCDLPENNNLIALENMLNDIVVNNTQALESTSSIFIVNYEGIDVLAPYLPYSATGSNYKFIAQSSFGECDILSTDADYESSFAVGDMECCILHFNDPNGTGPGIWGSIIGFKNMAATANAPNITYNFTVTAILSDGSTADISGYTSCIPLAQCCSEPPLAHLSQSQAQNKYSSYMSSIGTPAESFDDTHFYINENDFHRYDLGYVSDLYINYLNDLINNNFTSTDLVSMAIPDTSAYFISLTAFYDLNPSQDEINHYFDYLIAMDGYYNALNEVFSTKSIHFIRPSDFIIRGYAATFMSNSNLFDTEYLSFVYTNLSSYSSEKDIPTLDAYARLLDISCSRPDPCPALPYNMFTTPYIERTDPCEQHITDLINLNASVAFNQYIYDAKMDFKQAYIEKCLSAAEDFNVVFTNNEYHFTLYYYDQAGNLVKTIPPAGVHPIKPSATVGSITYPDNVYEKINEERNLDISPSQRTILTNHTLATTYEYNSLNQLVKQNTPDGGTSNFWYDALGRLVVSQNAQQYTEDKYSYTVYDPTLGRINEVGEIENTTSMTYALARESTALDAWIAAGTKDQITYTVYDEATSILGQDNATYSMTQVNLRGRVAAVYTDEEDDDLANQITFYSYDIHGNVNSIKQVNPIFTDNQEKMIDYNYDLVSGNVNEVFYQKNQKDQFIQRYEYDGDNRITNVWTSQDNIIWQQQAKYYYFKHGPLARVEIGNDKVQGIDYAYTIQGWLKNVNSENLVAINDMGKDGKFDGEGYLGSQNNVNAKVATDAFGFSLNYFSGDFSPIVQQTYNTANISPMADVSNISDLATQAPNLYNGNIRYMVTSILNGDKLAIPQLTAYRYDQLNRISSMKAYDDIDLPNNAWQPGAIASERRYNTSYSYDAMGNILSLDRNDRAEQDMDRLAYTYNYDGDGFLVNNRLMGVEDNESGNSVIAGDFIGTSAYVYDQIGNLTKDLSEEIDDIQWTVTGKVKKVIRVATSHKSDLEFVYDAMGNRTTKIEQMRDGSQLTGEKKITYYVRDASGNVMATYWETQNSGSDQQTLDELNIYGSSRIGMLKINQNLLTLPVINLNTTSPMNLSYQIGRTYFELSNHLGNVLTVVTDRKFAVDDGGGGISYYTPDVVSVNDYYPFGMQMSERSFSSDNYRYGFQGQEKDNEIAGDGNSYTAEYWQYDSRLGRRWNVDLIVKHHESPYATFANNPIWFRDPNGNDTISDMAEHSVETTNSMTNDKGEVTGNDIITHTTNTRTINYNDNGQVSAVVSTQTTTTYKISRNSNGEDVLDISTTIHITVWSPENNTIQNFESTSKQNTIPANESPLITKKINNIFQQRKANNGVSPLLAEVNKKNEELKRQENNDNQMFTDITGSGLLFLGYGAAAEIGFALGLAGNFAMPEIKIAKAKYIDPNKYTKSIFYLFEPKKKEIDKIYK